MKDTETSLLFIKKQLNWRNFSFFFGSRITNLLQTHNFVCCLEMNKLTALQIYKEEEHTSNFHKGRLPHQPHAAMR